MSQKYIAQSFWRAKVFPAKYVSVKFLDLRDVIPAASKEKTTMLVLRNGFLRVLYSPMSMPFFLGLKQ